MVITSKLFFENTNGWSNLFPLGGVPILNNDIQALENTAKMYGGWAIYNKWNCILQGCEVDEVNLTNKTVKILSGYFTIAGIVYYTDGFTSSFPFSLVAGSQTPDTRTFRSGDVHDVAVEYSYSIKTSGFNSYNDISGSNPSSQNLKPSNLGNEIFFDPYTHMRLEYIITNLSYGLNELRQGRFKESFSKTETGKNMVGGSLSENTGINKGRWKYYGWGFETTEYFPYVTNIIGSIVGGSNQIYINPSSLPPLKTDVAGYHGHDFYNAYYAEAYNNVDNRVINMYTTRNGSRSLQNIYGNAGSSDTDNHPYAFVDTVFENGNHSHNVIAANGQSLNGTPIPYMPPYRGVHGITWKGYQTGTDNHILQRIPYTNR